MSRVVELVSCRGAFGIIETPQDFFFRLYPDNSLAIKISRVESPVTSQSSSPVAVVESMNQDNQDEELKENDDEDCVAYYAIDTSARKVHGGDGVISPTGMRLVGVEYEVEFTVVRWDSERLDGMEMNCTARLSSIDGASGEYFDADDETEGWFDLSIMPATSSRAVTLKPLDTQLFPLTPGRYELWGCTLDDGGQVAEYVVQTELLPNGSVRGTAAELLYDEQYQLAGAWTREHLSYTQFFDMNDGVNCYMFEGAPTIAGIRGSWQNANPEFAQDSAECGFFDLHIVSCTRMWSTAVHRNYPLNFQQSTKMLLLSSLRAPARTTYAIPSALWCIILSYCGFDWFDEDLETCPTPMDIS